jgi:hypothetical protein
MKRVCIVAARQNSLWFHGFHGDGVASRGSPFHERPIRACQVFIKHIKYMTFFWRVATLGTRFMNRPHL